MRLRTNGCDLMPATSTACSYKATYQEIAEHHCHRGTDQKANMGIVVRGRFMPIPAQLPSPSCTEQGKNAEEYPGEFQAKDAGEFHEWRPHRLAEAFAAADQSLPGLSRLGSLAGGLLRDARTRRLGCLLRLLLCSDRCGSPRTVLCRFRRRGRGIRRLRRVHRRHQRLRGCTGANPKCTTEPNRIHG